MLRKNILSLILLVIGSGLIVYSLFGKGAASLDVKIKPATYIMPACYKVYANPDVLGGRFNLFKAIIKNNGTRTISNLKVEYRIPKYVDSWAEVPCTQYLIPGQTAVAICYPSFDQKITEKISQSKENAQIKITYGSKSNPDEDDESFSFTMLAVSDFAFTDMPASEMASYSDLRQNDPLVVCFLTEDPVLKYYTEKIQQKILKGEAYVAIEDQQKQANEAVRILKGVYNATLLSGMVYSGEEGLPVLGGEITTGVQRYRLPREVVTGNTGLCIELTLLYVRVLRNMGLDPCIFFKPNHAFPGVKVGNQLFAIEATSIGGPGLGGVKSADSAFIRGMQEVNEFLNAVRQGVAGYDFVDVNENYKQGIMPMELTDDVFAKQKIDEISAKWDEGQVTNITNNAQPANNNNQLNPLPHPDNPTSSTRTYSHGVTFTYPAGWQLVNSPYPQMPFLVSVISSPDRMSGIEVYRFEGYNNIDNALTYLRNVLYSSGLQINYTEAGEQNGFLKLVGTTYSQQTYYWVAAFRVRNSAVEGIASGSYTGNTTIAQQIVATIR